MAKCIKCGKEITGHVYGNMCRDSESYCKECYDQLSQEEKKLLDWHFYSDWEENGGILVVKYRPEMTEKDRYVVLHCVEVGNNGNIFSVDISSLNKIPEIVE